MRLVEKGLQKVKHETKMFPANIAVESSAKEDLSVNERSPLQELKIKVQACRQNQQRVNYMIREVSHILKRRA